MCSTEAICDNMYILKTCILMKAVKISTTSIWTFYIDGKQNLENIIKKMCCYIHINGNFQN